MHSILICLTFGMLLVIWLDMTRYTIPNWLSGAIFLLYPLGVYLAPVDVDWQSALMGMAAVFVLGYLLFLKRWMGGGDVKLIIACSLWVGSTHLLDFLFMLSVLGGLFAVLLLASRKILPLLLVQLKKAPDKLPRILQHGAPVPYGVAIAAAFLFMMWNGQIAAAHL